MVVGVGEALDQTVGRGAVDELDRRVVAELQQLGHVGERRGRAVGVAPHGQEQLVLGGVSAGGAGGVLGEAQEHAQRVAEPGQRRRYSASVGCSWGALARGGEPGQCVGPRDRWLSIRPTPDVSSRPRRRRSAWSGSSAAPPSR